MYGSFLRRARESRRLSQNELAEITGTPQPAIGEEQVRPEPATLGPDADPMARAARVEAVLALGDALREAKALP
ncbi:MAG: helix-turn-helix domain-containing protein [Acidimicrobiales bacterium]